MATLHLEIPLYEEAGPHSRLAAGFAGWKIVDDYLLRHWFDFAYECDFEKVIVYSGNAAFLHCFEAGEILKWPLDIEFRDGSAASVPLAPDDAFFPIESLNRNCAYSPEPDVFFLADLHWTMVCERLSLLNSSRIDLPGIARVGNRTLVHPSAILIEPYWIGERTWIGPGAVIEAGSVVGDDCIVNPRAHLFATHLGAGHSVGESIFLNGCTVEKGCIIQREERILHSAPEPILLEYRQSSRCLLLDTLSTHYQYRSHRNRTAPLTGKETTGERDTTRPAPGDIALSR